MVPIESEKGCFVASLGGHYALMLAWVPFTPPPLKIDPVTDGGRLIRSPVGPTHEDCQARMGLLSNCKLGDP